MTLLDSKSIFQTSATGDLELIGLTVKQYDSLISSGELPEDPTMELLNGFIVRKDRSHVGEHPMTVGDRHRMAILRLLELSPKAKKAGCFIQTQLPISLPPRSEPEPDAAIVAGKIDDYKNCQPRATDVSCVIEVSDSSLKRDLGLKLRIYAEGKIQQYVVINLVDDTVLVHTRPLGKGYLAVQEYSGSEKFKLNAGPKTIQISPAMFL